MSSFYRTRTPQATGSFQAAPQQQQQQQQPASYAELLAHENSSSAAPPPLPPPSPPQNNGGGSNGMASSGSSTGTLPAASPQNSGQRTGAPVGQNPALGGAQIGTIRPLVAPISASNPNGGAGPGAGNPDPYAAQIKGYDQQADQMWRQAQSDFDNSLRGEMNQTYADEARSGRANDVESSMLGRDLSGGGYAAGQAQVALGGMQQRQNVLSQHYKQGLQMKLAYLDTLIKRAEAAKDRDLQDKLQAEADDTLLAINSPDPTNPAGTDTGDGSDSASSSVGKTAAGVGNAIKGAPSGIRSAVNAQSSNDWKDYAEDLALGPFAVFK